MKFVLYAEHLIFQLILFWFFFGAYRIIGFDKNNFTFHNNRGNFEDADLMTTLYYTAMMHSLTGVQDVSPTSPASRALTALHTILSHSFGTLAVFDLVSGGSQANA